MRMENTLRTLGAFPSFPETVICLEKSQPRVPIAEAMEAGPAHRAFIDHLPRDWREDREVEIFSRMLYLKRGWYPLHPHFHFDWYAGQDGPIVETLMVLLGSGSRTEFVLGPYDLPDGPAPSVSGASRGPGETPREWPKLIEEGVRSGDLKTWFAEPDQLILFDNRTFHRATAATHAGWRVLIRAIRGRPRGSAQQDHRAPFTTARNGYIPETPAEIAAYEPYRNSEAP